MQALLSTRPWGVHVGRRGTSTSYSSRSRRARRAQKQRRCTMLLEFWALLPHNTSDLTPGVNHLSVENKDRRPEVVFSSLQSGGKPSPCTKHQNGQTCGASFFFFSFFLSKGLVAAAMKKLPLRDFPCAAHSCMWAACGINANGWLVLLIKEERAASLRESQSLSIIWPLDGRSGAFFGTISHIWAPERGPVSLAFLFFFLLAFPVPCRPAWDGPDRHWQRWERAGGLYFWGEPRL